MTVPLFDRLETAIADGDIAAALVLSAEEARQQQRFHELFEVRKMQIRHQIGLPLFTSSTISSLSTGSPEQQLLETGLLNACQEVGEMLLAEGKLREAWVYLRAVGEPGRLAQRMEQLSEALEDWQIDEMIELALGEGIAPALGFRFVLQKYGTCSSITALSGHFPALTLEGQQATAELLVRHVDRELRANLTADCRKKRLPIEETATIRDILDRDAALLEDGNHHIDISHLSATLGFARVLDDPHCLRLAVGLADYGSRLDAELCFPGEEPFVDHFDSHCLFFRALLDDTRATALKYFRERAHSIDAHKMGTLAAEVYIDLLSRCGMNEEAIREFVQLMPAGTGTAPTLFKLSTRANDFEEYLRLARQNDDRLGYFMGLVGRSGMQTDVD